MTDVTKNRSIVVENDGQTITVEPLTGDTPVTELYHYQLPMQFVSDENGASDNGGPYYAATGIEGVLRDDMAVTFLYDGPGGLSLVIVHDSPGVSQHGGGSVTWSITGLPVDGRWVVKDDLYRNPETNELADTNYDRWDVSGSEHVIDWTWGAKRTDGGVFRDPGDALDVRVKPAFNEEAALFELYYEGRIRDWQWLSGDLSNPDRIDLCRGESLSISTTTE